MTARRPNLTTMKTPHRVTDTPMRRAIERVRNHQPGKLSDDQVAAIWASLPADARADYLKRIEPKATPAAKPKATKSKAKPATPAPESAPADSPADA